jgi:hypothetical protein
VRASELKVGDIIPFRESCFEIQQIVELPPDHKGEKRLQFLLDSFLDYTFMSPYAVVARLLPGMLLCPEFCNAVEVREFWRAECHGMTKEGTEQECRDWIRNMGYAGTLEELTEIVKCREEVQS